MRWNGGERIVWGSCEEGVEWRRLSGGEKRGYTMACRCNRMGALRAPRRAGGTFAGRSSRYAKTQFRSRARRYAIQATGAPGATTVQMPNHFKKVSGDIQREIVCMCVCDDS